MATYAAFKHVELYNVGNAKKRVLKPPGGGSSDLFGSDNMPQTPRNSKNRQQSSIFAAPDSQRAGNVFRQGIHRYYLFGGETPRRTVAGQDSHNRLFGEVERPYTPAKNHMKSNLPIGAADQPDAGKTNGHSNGTKANGHHQNGNGLAPATNGHSSSNGNSNATANGYSNGSSSALSQNGSTHTSPKSSSSSTPRSPRFNKRNPVTGNGVEDYADKPRKPSSRRGGNSYESGNPVTGEGYKSGGAAEINTTVPSLNGGGHVINKNRIPPGGFSSGLW
ncbi:microtubule-associated protein Jupiter isoform X3 [Topomyia yanbarensis]|uniref:microtubule-associated protein Jupiter isoform X3 n=1 Tax=Topomyia yanbarensis TaxID=2498891 RepID=UPI00273C6430|nr:microtubule-associated protein Jupiter isoform X3 [Topomyia yanbarensis]